MLLDMIFDELLIVDVKVVKFLEVYFMFFLGYENEFVKIKVSIDEIENMYMFGSLVEYVYFDL